MKLTFATVNVPPPLDARIALDMSGLIHRPDVNSAYNLKPTLEEIYSPTFDQFYNDYLLNDDLAFMDMMKIMYSLYQSKNTILYYYDNDDQAECVAQLQRFIEDRYGIYPNYAFSSADIDNNLLVETEFSIKGLHNIDIDKARYIDLVNGSPIHSYRRMNAPKAMYSRVR